MLSSVQGLKASFGSGFRVWVSAGIRGFVQGLRSGFVQGLSPAFSSGFARLIELRDQFSSETRGLGLMM